MRDLELVRMEYGMLAKNNKQKILKAIDYILIMVQIIVAAVLGVKLFAMGIVPTIYLILYTVIILIINVGTFFSTKKVMTAVTSAIISVVITAGLLYGLIAVEKIDRTLNNVANDARLEVVQMSVYVRSEDTANELVDIGGASVGYLESDNVADQVISVINDTVDTETRYKSYSNILLMADALLNGTEDAIIMNSAYVDIISDQDGYEDFSDEIKEIYTYSAEVQVEIQGNVTDADSTQEKCFLSSDEDTFVIYISGIDMWGAVNARSRSDVNILAIVNMKTGHIQLINTPRDYYVYLPNQGANDKLTHAGLYGVESSEAAIENLYGINIDYYVRMNFSGFESIIDTLGGIDVYSQYDFTVDPIKHYTVGYNHVTGLEALAFARERHAFAAGDVQRGINQMEVIKAVINKMTSPNILAKYSEILDEVADCVMTDIPSNVIYDLVRYKLSNDVVWTIDSYTVTGTGEHTTTYSMPGTTCYVMLPNDQDVEKAKSLIESVLDEE